MSRRTARGKTKYQKDWEAAYPWAKSAEGDIYSTKCVFCSCTISVDTMGRSALKSHSNGEKHKKNTKAAEGSSPLQMWVNSTNKPSIPLLTTSSTTTSSSALSLPPGNSNPPQLQLNSAVSNSSTNMPSSSNAKTTSRMAQYLLNETASKAEAIWAIQTVMNHSSLRASASCTPLFHLMFPDSEIAKRMTMQKDKLSWFIVHGLCPYFKGALESILKQTEYLVLGFDESFNKISQNQQMDLGVRFWSSEENRVTSRFLTSAFLSHITSEDLLQAIKNNLSEENLKKVFQLSMDGPNVNLKLKRLFVSDLRSDEESPQLLELGFCGLHTVHNAFKTGILKTGWEIIEFFRAAHNLFKFAPARRGDFTRITGSKTFPLQMCSVRWVENGKVAKRINYIFPNLEKYVNELKGTKIEPTCKSFSLVVKALQDKLIRAKIAFFEFMCDEVEGFLREFQTDSQMTPFLHGSISGIVRSSMTKIVKEEVIKGNDLRNIDVLKKDKHNTYTNLKFAKDIDVGYGTRAALRKCTGNNDKDVLIFKQDCRTALQFFVSKLMEKSPLKYPLTKALTWLDPHQTTNDAQKCLTKSLDIILEANLMSTDVIQKADREFKELTCLPLIDGIMKSFERSKAG